MLVSLNVSVHMPPGSNLGSDQPETNTPHQVGPLQTNNYKVPTLPSSLPWWVHLSADMDKKQDCPQSSFLSLSFSFSQSLELQC